MYITKSLIDFLSISKDLSHSTILLTSLERVIYVASEHDNSIYLDHEISSDLKQILDLYLRDSSADEYLNTTMNRIIPIIEKKDIRKYRSQIILPIIQDKQLQGLLIFVSEDREYIESNLDFAKTTKHFVEIFSMENYL